MTYQEKFDELQNLFSEKFDVYKDLQKKLCLENDESDEFLRTKSEFEKSSNELQAFLIMFRENNASPNDEFGTTGGRCTQ